MANYEELYNIARGKYNNAVNNRNSLRNKLNSLNNQKDHLLRELEAKKETLRKIQEKKAKVNDVVAKVTNILSTEFSSMKSNVQTTSSDYLGVINVGVGDAANISNVYDSDFTGTKGNLESIQAEFNAYLRNFEGQETEAQTAVKNCNDSIASVNSQINNAGSLSTAQWYVDMYYSEMKEYERKMNE